MWVQDPVVGAEVERCCVSDLLMVPHLHFCAVCPFFDDIVKIDVVVDSIVVEFFLFDLVNRVSERLIDPEENIEHTHTHDY